MMLTNLEQQGIAEERSDEKISTRKEQPLKSLNGSKNVHLSVEFSSNHHLYIELLE